MKKNYFLFFIVAVASIGMKAQTPTIVETTPQNKNVILEEFTGIHCGYCPDGHERARSLEIANPGRFFAINIHSGGYAVPGGATEPDLRTPEGNAIDAYAGVAGYPAGMIQRTKNAGQLDINRGVWASLVPPILSQPSYVNVGVRSEIDTIDGHYDLRVHVQVYYTADMTDTVNYLNVALTQDSIVSTQSNYGTPPYNPGQIRADGKYIHLNMLRTMLSGTWGIRIGNWMTNGYLFDTTFVMPIPANISAPTTSAGIRDIPFIVKNTHVVAFITQGKEGVVTGNSTIGEPTYRVNNVGINEIAANRANLSVYPNPTQGSATIAFNATKAYSNVNLVVMNAAGQTVSTATLGNIHEGDNSFDLNANTFQSGTYFIKLVSNGQVFATQSFVKN